jgi:hypothetical protein
VWGFDVFLCEQQVTRRAQRLGLRARFVLLLLLLLLLPTFCFAVAAFFSIIAAAAVSAATTIQTHTNTS